jgi:hypothetical protein
MSRPALKVVTQMNESAARLVPKVAANASSLKSSLVLRVLSGPQQGAQARMRHQRLLVGNLQTECDVVLDVGSTEPHACLVRASADGWTVLCIAGNLWVGNTWIATQQTEILQSGDVLTLGEVSFCIANTDTIDWAQVRKPERLDRPATQLETPRVEPLSEIKKQNWLTQLKQRAGFSTMVQADANVQKSPLKRPHLRSRFVVMSALCIGLMLAGAGAYLMLISTPSPSTQATPGTNSLAVAQKTIKALPWASEISVQADPRRGDRVLLSGYLPNRTHTDALTQALQQQGLQAEHRWAAVNELTADLLRRLGVTDVATFEPLRYIGQGAFVMQAKRPRFETLDRAIRRALQDMPPVRAIELQLSHHTAPDANNELIGTSAPTAPVIIQYMRAENQPNGMTITGLDQLLSLPKLQRFDVRELRLGRLASVVLDNDVRYFEGSTLPGGALLSQITPTHLLVQVGGETSQIPMSPNVQVTSKAHLPLN